MERHTISPTKIVYDHIKDYPTSTEGYHDIGIPAVAAALYCEQMPAPDDERDDKRPPWFDHLA